MALSTPGVHSRVQQHVALVRPNEHRDRIAALVVVSRIPNPDDAREVLYALGLATPPPPVLPHPWADGTYVWRMMPMGGTRHAVRPSGGHSACGNTPRPGWGWRVPDPHERDHAPVCATCKHRLPDGAA